MAINKNNKNFQITLDPESANILETLAERFHTSKSIIIRNALKVYAARKTHNIKLVYSTFLEVEQTEPKPSGKKVNDPNWKEKYDNMIQELTETLPEEESKLTWKEIMDLHKD